LNDWQSMSRNSYPSGFTGLLDFDWQI
jgi:hypothetical protein